MKRFLSVIVLAVFFAAGLFADFKITESQIETFLNSGSYIKVIVYKKDKKPHVSYYYKQAISEIFIQSDGRIELSNDKKELIQYFEPENLTESKIDSNNNLILTYQY